MKCPLCERETVKKTVGAMFVKVCEKCPGIWFSTGDMEDILDRKTPVDHLIETPETSETQESMTESKENLICPVCTGNVRLTRMKTPITSKIDVSGCSVCYGKWVAGEGLKNMVDYCTPKGIKALLLKIFPSKSKEGLEL